MTKTGLRITVASESAHGDLLLPNAAPHKQCFWTRFGYSGSDRSQKWLASSAVMNTILRRERC